MHVVNSVRINQLESLWATIHPFRPFSPYDFYSCPLSIGHSDITIQFRVLAFNRGFRMILKASGFLKVRNWQSMQFDPVAKVRSLKWIGSRSDWIDHKPYLTTGLIVPNSLSLSCSFSLSVMFMLSISLKIIEIASIHVQSEIRSDAKHTVMIINTI